MLAHPESEPVREGVVPVPEIVFYGDYTWLLENNLKLITFRKPNPKYNLVPGTLVNARSTNTGEVVPLRVIGIAHGPLEDYSDIHLLLDGFLDAYSAVETLSEFYTDIDYETPMTALYTITDELFQSLEPEQRERMLANGLDVLDDIDQPDAAIIWPALCFWLLENLDEADDDAWAHWIVYLIRNDFVDYVKAWQLHADTKTISKDELRDIALGSKDTPEFKKYILLED